MSTHRALLFDEDRSFLELLETALGPCGFTIDVAARSGAALDALLATPPDLIFIAVDLPEKEGFTLFTRIRGLAKRAPIVLTTSTLSATEMSLHAKLRLHADRYLNKSSLSAERVREALASLLPDALAGVEAAPRAPLQALRDGTGRIPEWLADAGADDGSELLSGWLLDREVRHDDPLAGPGDSRLAQLEAERDRLRAALETARRDAASSPFGREVLALREELSQASAKVDHLELEVAHRDGELARTRDTRPELEQQVAAAVRSGEAALARAVAAEAERDAAKAVARRLEDEQRARDETSKRDFVDRQEEVAGLLLAAEAELSELRTQLAQRTAEMEHDRQARADDVVKLRVEKDQALAAFEKRVSRQREQVEQEHARALAIAREVTESEKRSLAETRRQLAEVERTHGEAVAALRAKHAEAMQELEAKQRAALSAKHAEWEIALQHAVESERAEVESRLAAAQHEHDSAVAALERNHAEAARALAGKHQAVLAAKQTALTEAGRAELEYSRREHEEAIAALHQQHAREKSALERACDEALKGQQAADTEKLDVQRALEEQSAAAEAAAAQAAKLQRELNEQQAARTSLESRLQEGEETIASLRSLINDLQHTAGGRVE